MPSGRIDFEIPKDVVETCRNFLKTEDNRYIIVGGDLETEKLKVLKITPRSTPFGDLLKELPEDDCRFIYAAVDDEIIFIHWSPAAAGAKKTSMLSLTKDGFAGAAHAPEVEIVAQTKEDLSDAKLKEALGEDRVQLADLS